MRRFVAVLLTGVSVLALGPLAPASADDLPLNPATFTLQLDDLDAVDAQGRLLTATIAEGPRRVEVRRFSGIGVADPGFGTGGVASVPYLDDLGEPRLTVLDDGALAIEGRTLTDRHVWRLSSDGVPDPTYAGDGRLELSLGRLDIAGDGSVTLAEANGSTVLEVRRYAASGALDASFGTDGVASGTCCVGAYGQATVAASAVEPGGPMRYLVRGGDRAFVVEVGPTGTFAVQEVDERSVDLADDGGGGILLVLLGTSLRRLGPDLVPDPSFGGAGEVPLQGIFVDLVRWGDRTVVATRYETGLEGTVRLYAVTTTGLDPTFGVGGVVVSSSGRPPQTPVGLEIDRTIEDRSVLLASAGDAGLVVLHQWRWAAGMLLPSVGASGLDQYWPDGTHVAETTFGPRGTAFSLLLHGGFAYVGARTFPSSSTSPVRKVSRTYLVPPPELAPAPIAPMPTSTTAPRRVTLTWPAVTTATGTPVTGARISTYEAGVAEPVAVLDVPGATTEADVLVPLGGRAYRFTVALSTWSGWGPPSARSTAVIAPFATPRAFVEQLSQDLRGRPTGAAIERVAPLAALDGGATAAEVALDTLDGSGWRGAVDPVIRLYDAYLQRRPDPAGLTYWSAQRARLSVAAISARFAAAPEFTRTYGHLGDRAFVELVYRNALRRPGDGAGIAYWTGRLQRGTTSRGQLMASFSESPEHVRALAPVVDVIDVHAALLRRLPTAAEVEAWTGPSPRGTTLDLVAAVLSDGEYEGRFT